MSSLKRLHQVVLLFACAVIVVALGLERPVMFENRTADEWLSDLEDGKPLIVRKRATHAVQSLGTNALPAIFRKLGYKEPKIRKWISSYIRLNVFTHKEELNEHAIAIAGFEALGPIATPAIPALTNLFAYPGKLAYTSGLCLSAIGSDAVPFLHQALTATNYIARAGGVSGLAYYGRQTNQKFPAVTNLIDDPAPLVRIYAISAVVDVVEPEYAVPILTEKLSSSDDSIRWRAARGLGEFRGYAGTSLPLLKALTNDSSSLVREEVILAIEKLETAPK